MNIENVEWKFEKEKNGCFTTCKQIGNVSDFINCINNVWDVKWQRGRENLRRKYSVYIEEELPWYRGVNNREYELIPGLYWQFKDKDDEQIVMIAEDIREEFKRRGNLFIQQNRFYEDGEWLQLMQHYAAPTRLLDWTEGALIALYFSIRLLVFKKDNNAKTTPCVWMLNPSWLNAISIGTSLPAYLDESAMGKYPNTDEKAKSYLNEKELPKYPIAIYPKYSDSKMLAQKSAFTLHGKIKDSFSKLCLEYSDAQICKILINPEKIIDLAKELRMMGITESTIFPDLKSIANEIRNEKGVYFSFDR